MYNNNALKLYLEQKRHGEWDESGAAPCSGGIFFA